ncbi:MAG: hypothetical protein LKG90_05205 [Lachnospiraceae bacterium]|nr:hypothetical protein [Lachnospiraceae bacterium]MCH4066312.1 hypothetical protein [Lachnospiraceae bacterium]MCH4112342.1 hypothetical protein [Lachnospiraceae bacterium]MCI1367293.1 hypothetical protein [Lachnospiraceae bacterium]MCI1390823.1 hypothetical protein [Lachnospiraceae bacterium]
MQDFQTAASVPKHRLPHSAKPHPRILPQRGISMEKEPVDPEKVAILLQRRYNYLKEVRRLTGEAAEAANRQDAVSFELILQMRGEELERCDRAFQDILLLGEESPEAAETIRRLVLMPPDQIAPESAAEKTIAEVRAHCTSLIDEIKEQDRILNLRVGKDKSIYQAD